MNSNNVIGTIILVYMFHVRICKTRIISGLYICRTVYGFITLNGYHGIICYLKVFTFSRLFGMAVAVLTDHILFSNDVIHTISLIISFVSDYNLFNEYK